MWCCREALENARGVFQPKMLRTRGRRVARQLAVIPMPGSKIVQMAKSAAEAKKPS